MMKLLRSQSQTVLIIVLGVIGLGFLFYGNAGSLLTSPNGRVSNDYGSIDGQKLTLADLSAAVRNTHDVMLMSGQNGTNAQVAQAAWAQLLLLHEADRLHIQVSTQEVLDRVHNMPMFQKDGVYSPDLFQSRMAELESRLHISIDSFAAIIQDNIRANAVSQALLSTVRGSAKDIDAEYKKYYAPVTVSVVSFDPKNYLETVAVTDADIQNEYKAHPDNPAYRTAEKRKIDYVLFLLSPDQAKLADKEKQAAKEALGEKALDFALAFQPDPSATAESAPPPPNFLAEAAKRGLNPATTDFFAADTTPANVPPSPAFNNAAFALTKENPISKVIELDNGVAVLHLVDIQPSELQPLDAVKAVITQHLQQVNARKSAQVTAQIDGQFIKALVAKGTDFKTAAAGMKLKVETLPAFAPFTVLTSQSPQTDPRLPTIAEGVIALAPGEVSNPLPFQDDNSFLVVHVDSRGTPDPAGMADFEKRYRQSQDEELRSTVYRDWMEWADKQPGTRPPPDLEAYGSVD